MKKLYTVAGKEFYQNDLVYGQLRMLRDRLKKYPISNLSFDHLIDLVMGEVTSILSVVLIDVGTTQQQKVKAGEAGAKGLEDWLNENLRPGDAQSMVADFFALNPVESLMSGFQKPLAEHNKATGDGSSIPLSSLPMVTLPNSATS